MSWKMLRFRVICLHYKNKVHLINSEPPTVNSVFGKLFVSVFLKNCQYVSIKEVYTWKVFMAKARCDPVTRPPCLPGTHPFWPELVIYLQPSASEFWKQSNCTAYSVFSSNPI